jgi:hypothetical protein
MVQTPNDDLFQYAKQHHKSPFDLKEDLRRISYVKRLLKRKKHEEHRQLILNHIQILINAFGREHAVYLLNASINTEPENEWLQNFLC